VNRMNSQYLGLILWLGFGSGASLCADVAPTLLRHYSATNLWQTRVALYTQSSPALATNGVIYITGWDGRLRAINPDSTSRWEFRFGRDTASSPAVGADGAIYFGCRDHRLYAVDATGKKRWAFKTGGWVDASPAISTDGTVYCGSFDKQFYALTATGAKKWEFYTDGRSPPRQPLMRRVIFISAQTTAGSMR